MEEITNTQTLSPVLPPSAQSNAPEDVLANLAVMFPNIERGVIMVVLEGNSENVQRTIDQLLLLDTEVEKPKEKEKEPETEKIEEKKLSKEEKAKLWTQMRDDELLARSLQMNLNVESTDDEQIAKEMVRMETDEILAAKLYEKETDKIAKMFSRTRKSSFLYSSESDNEVEAKPKPEEVPEEPIIDTIEKKWTEFTGEFKSMMDSFTTSLSKTFSTQEDNVPPPPPPPQNSPYHSSDFQKDDLDLSSSDDEEELEPLIRFEERKPASVK